ncbi:cadherin domain-containing protein [Kiloniella sp.]|uniref:cadherin domain-containing protein n=1 Tax=Kiloniella sp. TaxID=1938587 RepID=UPI003B010EEF
MLNISSEKKDLDKVLEVNPDRLPGLEDISSAANLHYGSPEQGDNFDISLVESSIVVDDISDVLIFDIENNLSEILNPKNTSGTDYGTTELTQSIATPPVESQNTASSSQSSSTEISELLPFKLNIADLDLSDQFIAQITVQQEKSENTEAEVPTTFVDTTALTDITLSESSVSEAASIGDTVATISATDAESNNFTYIIVSDPDNKFIIEGDQLKLNAGVDAETSTAHTVTIEVDDGSGNTYQETFSVGVSDVDDTAATDIALSNSSVTESAGVGTVVGNLSATDVDSSSFSYSIVSDPDNKFIIDGDQLKLNAGVDAETSTAHSVTIEVDDGSGNTYQETFSVGVTDVDDTAATDIALSNSSVAESAGVGTVVGNLSATDVDSSSFSYSIVSDPDNKFIIDGDQLKLNAGVDAETSTAHSVTIEVDDGSGNIYQETFSVGVTDVDDTAATDIALSNNSVAESAGVGTVVGNLSATDVDSSSFSYSIVSDPDNKFIIDGDQLKLNAGVDAETSNAHSVTIEVNDGAGNTYQETFSVGVTDVDDTAATDMALSNNSVAESAGVGTVVGNLSATDVDSSSFSYSIVSDPDNKFIIDGDQLKLNASVDAENSTAHSVTIQVDDGAGNTYQETFSVGVTDVDDTAATDIALSNSSVAESAGVGTVVGNLSATDVDSSSFSYTIVSDPDNKFVIDGDQLKLNAGVDAETSTAHSVTIEVDDGSGNTYQETFSVGVTDVDDTAATDIALSNNSVAESAGVGTVVGNLSATDVDSSSFSYSIVSDPDNKFVIDGDQLKLNAGVDAETSTAHSVTIEVDDGSGNTYQETFSVGVTDVDDTAATDIALSNNSVVESAGVGTVVGNLSAIDVDSSSFSYTIVSDPDNKFVIDGDQLKLNAGVDAETSTAHSVTIQVDDGSGNTYQETFSVGVTDVDDTAATDIALSNSSVAESAGVGTVVGNLSATDVDSSTFSYTIVSDPDSKFVIDGDQLKLNASVDAENSTAHSVTIQVDDGAGNTYQETFSVGVTDVDDTAATDIALSNNSVVESAGVGTVVGNLSATDVDSSSFSYTIVSDPDNKFVIDGDQLKLNAGVDAETSTAHSVTIEVDDGSGNTYQETFSVGVTDVDDTAATDIALSNNSVAESAGVGTVVGNLSATDVDSSSFSYSIVSDPDNKFVIDGDQLKLNAGVDAETSTAHSVTIEVDDGSGNTYQETFSVGVTDVDDTAATDIALSNNSVVESAGVGTVVGNLSAIDVDSSSFSYTIVSDPDNKFVIDGDQLKLNAGVDAETSTAHSVTIQVDDGSGNTYQETFSVGVTDVDDTAATDIALSNSSVAESAGVGTVVGNLSATDVDSSTFSYTIVSDPDSKFVIDGDQLKLNASVDAENSTAHSVTIQVDDGAGNTYQETFSVGVTDVDDTAATDIALSNNSVVESAGVGTVVGNLSAIDVDSSSFSYSIVSDPDNKFVIDGDQLKLNAGVDAETSTAHSVTIEVDDGAGNTYQETFSVGVTDVDDTAATDIALSNNSVAESAGVGTVVGNLSATDVDSSSFSYSIVSDPDNKFIIDGDQLKLNAGVDAESSTAHSVTIQVDDGSGNTYQETFSVGVTDVDDTAATDIALSNTSIAENIVGLARPEGTALITDAAPAHLISDSSSSNTYDFGTENAGKTVNISFDTQSFGGWEETGTYQDDFTVNVNGVQQVFSHEGDATSYSFQVVTDASGKVAIDYGIDVTANGEGMDVSNLVISTVGNNWDTSVGAVVGDLSATDVDSSSFTYTIVSDPDSKFVIDGSQLKLAAGVDAETSTAHSVTIEVDDGAGNTYQETFSIGVSDVDDNAPTDIALSNSSIAENAGVGSVIGNLSATDVDSSSFTYTIISNPTQGSGVISSSNISDTSNGFSVTAQSISGANLTDASSANVSTNGNGFGVSGAISNSDSGMNEQLGYDQASAQSEKLIVDFDNEVDTADVSFKYLFDSFDESAHWQAYNDGVLVAEGDFNPANNQNTGTFTINPADNFDQLVFTAKEQTDGSDGSDYLLTQISYTEAPIDDSTLFSIDGDQLKLAAGVDYENATSHAVTVEVNDGAGHTYQETFTINVGDVNDVQTADIEDPGSMSGATIIGTSGNDDLDGTNAKDEIWGLGGNDTIKGGNQADTLIGGTGNDFIEGGNSGDILYGGSGNDTLYGENSSDTIYGGSGNDIIQGGNGNDFIYAGSGNDTMTGDNGNDVFVFDGSSSVGDSNWVNGGSGVDTIDLSSAMDGWTVVLDNGDTFSSTDTFDAALITDDTGTLTTGNGATVTFESVESFTW